MTFKTRSLFLALSLMIGALEASAAVPQVLNHQGRVSVGGENFHGDGQFKFALVNEEGTTSYWSNDGTSIGGAEPSSPVTLDVNKGLYSVLLGDVALLPDNDLSQGGQEAAQEPENGSGPRGEGNHRRSGYWRGQGW